MIREKFIKRANIKHNNKYDYSLLPDIILDKNKYQIICPIHGIFEQNAGTHLRKNTGCVPCSRGYPVLKNPVDNKICSSCCKEKPKSEFYSIKSSQCKECCNIGSKLYFKSDRGKKVQKLSLEKIIQRIKGVYR